MHSSEPNCPICYSHSISELYRATSQEAACHFIPVHQDDPDRFIMLCSHLETLWQGKTVQVMQCKECNFCFAYPYKSGDREFYTLAYQRSGYPSEKWEYDLTLQALSTLYSKDAFKNLQLLEIGAGNGAFLRKITPALLPPENIVCTEYADYGVRELKRLGVECLDKDIRAVDDIRFSARFSIICLFQVLEHMDRLDDLFGTLTSMATTDAHLFIAVPNEKRITFNEQNGAVLDMPPNHIGRWNRRCFEMIGARHGWAVTQHQIEEEGFLSKLKTFANDRYYRSKQRPGSISHWVAGLHSRWQRPAEIATIGATALGVLPLFRSLSKASLGNTQWVHMTRTSGS